MRIYSMDNLIIEIYNIRNIESISIYDMTSPKDSKMEIIPSMLITYDGGKTINLCSRDKYFDTFVKKVIEVYNNEKNNVLEDSLTDPFKLRRNIKIDDRTKSILESGALTEINSIYQFYSNKKSYDWSLLFQNDEVKLLISIIKYHLKELFSKTDKNINFDDSLNGYRNNYLISGEINGLFTYFPLNLNKIGDNNYLVEVGGLLEKNNPVTMNISFLKDKISVDININKYNITGSFTYLITTDIIKEIQNIKKDNIPIYYKNSDLEEVDNSFESITDFDHKNNFKWFKLPWNAIYGINNSIQKISETEKIIQIYNMYVTITKESFMKKEYFSRNYKRNNIGNIFGKNIILDEAIKNTIGTCLNKKDNIYIIETSFLDTTQSSGYYDEKLRKKYFYHLFESTNIENIDNQKLVNISQEDGILDNGDILNDSLTLKLVRRK